MQFSPEFRGKFGTCAQDGIAVRSRIHEGDDASRAKIGSSSELIGLYKNHRCASMREHLFGIGSEHKSFEPAASVCAQNYEILFQFFGVFGNALWNIALGYFMHVARYIETPTCEPFGD